MRKEEFSFLAYRKVRPIKENVTRGCAQIGMEAVLLPLWCVLSLLHIYICAT